MTEHQMDVCDMLRGHLGVRYQGTLEDGRKEIIRLIASDMGVSHEEAEVIFRRELDAGRIRYITAEERDVEANRIASDPDYATRGRHTDLDAQARNLTINAIPGQGGVSTGTAGLSAGAAAPVIAGANTTPVPPIMPAAAARPINDVSDADYFEGGYWDLCGDRAGVVPSRSRKGQVEPLGT
jgi:hypothetical protein